MANRFKTTLMLFLSGLQFVPARSDANVGAGEDKTAPPDDPVKLRPLNLPGDNLFAQHRSHSSHRSHRSSSGGGGGYTPPAQRSAPTQPRLPPSGTSGLTSPGTAQPTDPGRAAPVSPVPSKPTPTLSLAEKRKLQVMRVQLSLTRLGIYTGSIDGELGSETKEAIRRFQAIKDQPQTGLMTTDTLNALGVPAVQ